MSTIPTGDLALTVHNLETLVASSENFQFACGILSGEAETRIDAARSRIYWPGERLPQPIVRPYALIKLKPGTEFQGNDSGGAGFYPKIQLQVLIEIQSDKLIPAKERLIVAWNFFGAVIQDMLNLSKTDGHLEVTNLSLDEGPLMSHPDESDCYDSILLGVHVF